MLLLLGVAFVAGLVTVFSPCVLPVLPVVLGSSVPGGKARPLGVIAGLFISFSVFTLALTEIVALLHLSANFLRFVAIVVIAVLGLSLLIPRWHERIELLLSRLRGPTSTRPRSGWWGGMLTGVSLGLVWVPCAGPILASVTTLAATQQVSAGTVGGRIHDWRGCAVARDHLRRSCPRTTNGAPGAVRQPRAARLRCIDPDNGVADGLQS